jgi:hypothetical protein
MNWTSDTFRILLAAFGCWAAFAAPTKGQGVYIAGTLDCGEWIVARTKGRSVAIEHFVIGFLDGLITGHFVEFWNADGHMIDRDSVYLWLDNYCRSHPLKPVPEGIIALYKERSGWDQGK